MVNHGCWPNFDQNQIFSFFNDIFGSGVIRRWQGATGAYTMFQDNHFVYITIKTPQTEENLLYKLAQPLFWTSCDHFEFYTFEAVFMVFEAIFNQKSTFWPILAGFSSILTPDSSLK